MIRIDGTDWGCAREIAEALGPDVTIDMVRRWAERDGLSRTRLTGDDGRPMAVFPLDQAAAIEAAKRMSGRGRPRGALRVWRRGVK